MSSLTIVNLFAVSIGASVGACARWLVGGWLNAAGWPWGTMVVNLVGGYLVGVALAVLALHPEWPQWVRLMAITGFLGGLTTFSTFSAEAVGLLERGAYVTALGYVGISLLGSLALTAFGLFSAQALLR